MPEEIKKDANDDAILDGLGSDPESLEDNASQAARVLIRALDRAVSMQSGQIKNYVARVRRNSPEASPREVQKVMDKHFTRLSTGTGAGVGATAAVPGIGFVTGTAAVGAESLVFLDAAAFYTMANAYLRGVDIDDPQRRRALILVVLLGTKGTAIVDTVVGDLDDARGLPTGKALNRFSGPALSGINDRLMRAAIRRVGGRLARGWIGKIMPLGIGAVIGTVANRRLAKSVVGSIRDSLGAPPEQFAVALEDLPTKKQLLKRAKNRQVDSASKRKNKN